MSKRHDGHEILTGQRFGRLLVAERLTNASNGARRFRCLCDCGATHECRAASLKHGSTNSCGCLRREGRVTHGKTDTLTHKRWSSMRARCLNKSAINYPQYGGRGVTICDRWLNSFTDFLADMGECPGVTMTLDRIKNELGYEPGNCRWATKTEQSRNRSFNHLLTHNGETLGVSVWAEKTGITSHNILNRLRMGWTVEKTLTTFHDARAGRKARKNP